MKKVVMALVVSIFMGITVISLGLGAAFPSINRIAKPFVCPNGAMVTESQNYNPYPGKVVMTRTWYCEDSQTQSKTTLELVPVTLYAGSLYGLMLFLLLFFVGLIRKRK